jgi:hypothetical protein
MEYIDGADDVEVMGAIDKLLGMRGHHKCWRLGVKVRG